MIVKTRFAGIALGIAMCACFGSVAAADKDMWPGTKVGEPAPKLLSVPPALAKNLAKRR